MTPRVSIDAGDDEEKLKRCRDVKLMADAEHPTSLGEGLVRDKIASQTEKSYILPSTLKGQPFWNTHRKSSSIVTPPQYNRREGTAALRIILLSITPWLLSAK